MNFVFHFYILGLTSWIQNKTHMRASILNNGAKGCDHVIVRPLDSHPKVIPYV